MKALKGRNKQLVFCAALSGLASSRRPEAQALPRAVELSRFAAGLPAV